MLPQVDGLALALDPGADGQQRGIGTIGVTGRHDAAGLAPRLMRT